MAIVCPTVLAGDPHGFRSQIERVEPFAKRIQIDLTDGDFAPTKTIDVDQLFMPEKAKVDFHLMYRNPSKVLDKLIKLEPHTIIFHYESDDNIVEMFNKLDGTGIQHGVAILPETEVNDLNDVIGAADHVLIFAGHLGYFGGEANLEMLDKVEKIRKIKDNIEIGWDGGVSNQNIKQLADGGINVLNVGSYIQRSEDPKHAYAILNAIITG